MIVHRTAEQPTHFRAAGCFCMLDGRLLMIQRHRGKSFGLHWSVPTGKLEVGETPRQCMIRELREEVGIRVDADALIHLATSIVDDRGMVFEYTAFTISLPKRPRLKLERQEIERTEWVGIDRIEGRLVVPYFYNTLTDLLEWQDDGEVHWSFVPQPEAKGIIRRSRATPGHSPMETPLPGANAVMADLFS